MAFPDAFPLSQGHCLIVPRPHQADFFGLTQEEQGAIWALVQAVRRHIEANHAPDGYNIGINIGDAAGQTVAHAHLHVIPRHRGDVPDPRGGIRGIFPTKARYWEKGVTDEDQRGAIGFAEKVIELLDEGRYTATYKYALPLALMEVCLEHTQSSGAAPEMVTTRQLADKIVELYWAHTVPFAGLMAATVLGQNVTGQAEIITAIMRFRARRPSDPSVPPWEPRMRTPEAYERLVRVVEWKLIEMPLPRLQIMGQSYRPFIYEIYWGQRIEQREVTRYQAGDGGSFDNRVMLFGADRTRTAKIRAGPWEIQRRRCFYCDMRMAEPVLGQVDHFLPWSRYPDENLENFVVADKSCNGFKSSSLAAANHLTRWSRRFADGSSDYAQLTDLAKSATWVRQPNRSLNVARAIYLRLPDDARLWLRRREFVRPDSLMIGTALHVP